MPSPPLADGSGGREQTLSVPVDMVQLAVSAVLEQSIT